MKTILVVEDQLEVLKLLEVILREEGRRILLAESGEKAVEIAREAGPDLVLLDVMLPGGIDGYEVARTLKRDRATSGCSIVFMTAKVQEQDRVDAFEAGADDFIGKPFNIELLKNKVRKLLE